jgi:hypothetical protein
MRSTRILSLAVLSTLLPVAGWATTGWSELKAGMTRAETTAVLGTEMVGSRGRGFEVAIYEGRAEVVFLNGQLVAWTPPANTAAPAAPVSAWQFDQMSRVRAGSANAVRPTPAQTATRPGAILPAYRL